MLCMFAMSGTEHRWPHRAEWLAPSRHRHPISAKCTNPLTSETCSTGVVRPCTDSPCCDSLLSASDTTEAAERAA